jgi:hypothetical protein
LNSGPHAYYHLSHVRHCLCVWLIARHLGHKACILAREKIKRETERKREIEREIDRKTDREKEDK